MGYIKAIDTSQWQGTIAWPVVKSSGVEIAIIKMSGGDAGLYTDSKANANYYGAKSAGLAIGGYHFAGGGNATNEADFFISCMSPLEKDDVLVLDWEIPHANPVGWCLEFVNRVHDRTGVWPLIYMSGSTVTSYNWNPVLQNCGLWVANWNNNPNVDVLNQTYVMHQYTSDGSVSGINGRVDLDAWFGSVDQFKKYGFQPTPPVVPPVTPPPVVITPVTPPVVVPPVTPPPVVKPEPTPYPNWFIKFWTALITSIKSILKKGQ